MRPRAHASALLASLTLGLLALRAPAALAGGNTQVRNPANPSQVITRLWDDRQLPVRWLLSSDGLPGSGIGNAALQAELTAAFDGWEGLPASKLDFTFGGEVPARDGAGGTSTLGAGIDGRNLVTFTDPDMIFPSGVLAVSITFTFTNDTVITNANNDLDGDGTPDLPNGTYPAGRIFDSDIVFNSSEPWSINGLAGSTDIRAVALHEVGHSFGLCHSMIRDAVMWPFLSSDVAAARTLKSDDAAFASHFYPAQPAFSAAFGSIRGTIRNGFTNGPVLGAHVFAVDPSTGASAVGAYSGDDGGWVIPGLAPGNYLVAIEPLDGDPVGLDPFRINDVVRFTFDTDFPEEFYDADEAAVEADPLAGVAVAVTAGADTTDVDLLTNTLIVPGVSRVLRPGYNLLAYPVAVPAGLDAAALLAALGDESEATAVDRFVPETGTFERAGYDGGVPAGAVFPIRRGEAYAVHMKAQKAVAFSGATDCPALDLARGLNLVGIPCPPAGYTSRQLLQDIGSLFEIASIERFDPDAGTFETTQYTMAGFPTGADFPVVNGEGYAVTMLAAKAGVRVPPAGSVFPPVITGLTPGQGVPGTIVVVLGANFDSDGTKDLVTFNGVAAGVVFATPTSLTVTVPNGATTGPVRVTVGARQSNTMNFVVAPATIAEGPGPETALVSGQTVQGTIGADGEQDRYTFTALAGSVVTARAQSVTPGVPDLVLVLEDPFGVMVASDDNGGGGTNPRINNFELHTTGTHTVVVSNVPGSGTGAYTLSLAVVTHAAPPQVSILSGNFQSALAGTDLPIPLSVFVTGLTGAPLAGVPVTFTATDATIGGSSAGPIFAGTVVLATNASGIVTVATTLSGTPGVYDITVTVDGAPAAASFMVAATNTAVTQVVMNGDQQMGTVNLPLANPLQIVLKDSGGNAVPNALVAFLVAGGAGTVTPSGGQLSNATGTVQTAFKLGKKAADPQIVAAFVPGQAKPLLFEAFPQAAPPAKTRSVRSNFSRLSMGVTVFNALWVEVTDAFDNPVEGALVNYGTPAGLTAMPGLGPDGKFYTDFKTDKNGLNVAQITAATTSPPTVDELGNHRAGPKTVTASVGGAPLLTFDLDVDMGPVQVSKSMQNMSGLIGQPLGAPVEKEIFRYQRVDRFKDVAPMDGKDDDDCEFTDEDFTQVESKGIKDVTLDFSVKREDGEDEAAAGLMPTRTAVPSAITGANGVASTGLVTLGDVGGVNKVTGRTAGIDVIFYNCDKSVALHQQAFISGTGFAEATNVIAIPVVITATATDPGSGIDLLTFSALLNGNLFFNGGSPPAVLPTFPEKLEVIAGGRSLSGVSMAIAENSAFPEVKVVYRPSRPKLTPANLVGMNAVRDRAGNPQAAATAQAFAFP